MTTKDEDDRIFALIHAKGKDYIEHFSTIKIRYKKLTITYITAVFLALAYIAANKESFVSINKIYIICFITILSLLGVNLIRFLDIYVNHEQIRMLFKYLISMEKTHPKLEKSYFKISKILYGKKSDPVVVDFLYYGSINLGIIIFSAIVLIAEISEHHSSWGMAGIFGALLLFLLWEVYSYTALIKKRLKTH